MGNKYYVWAWGKHEPTPLSDSEYSNKEMWRGQSVFAALYNLWKIKRQGWGLVTLECR